MKHPLRVAVVHYHLKRGGVTRVVESALRGLKSASVDVESVVLAGEIPDTFAEPELASAVQGIRYSNVLGTEQPDAQTLLESLKNAAIDKLGSLPDVWHFHNHSLGKNSAMPGVISRLAHEGAALLLQMHDFAEDGRPENYTLNQIDPAAGELYPDAPQINYAVLNDRDYGYFTKAGVSKERIHTLPNPVEGATNRIGEHLETNRVKDALRAKRLFLYPVRAVRRKNLGEFVLWSLYAQPGDQFATTLGPTNKNFHQQYETWKQFASTNELPIHFAIGESDIGDFDAIVAASDAIMTTSIAEGFGLAFLEPWLYGKAIIGRDLPTITEDFKKRGIGLSHLYTSVGIPFKWICLDQLRNAIEAGLEATYRTYHRPLPKQAVDDALHAISVSENHIDFGGLSETMQIQVLQKLINDPHLKDEVLFNALDSVPSDSQISENSDLVSRQFGLPAYSEKLVSIYSSLKQTPPKPPTFLDASKLLSAFLTPESFRLLRT